MRVIRSLLLIAACVCFTWSRAAAAADEARPQWVVVTAPSLRAELEPLCEHRRGEGLAVTVIQTSDVLTPPQIRAGDAAALKERIHAVCRQSKAPSYVLLVGAVNAADDATAEKVVVPALRGTVGRMKGEPSDNGYGCLEKDLLPRVAVGRFPARSADELRRMVRKALAFEKDRSPGAWRNRLTLLAGNPGGSSAVERRFAEWFVQNVADTRLAKVHPLWTGRGVIHAAGSPLYVPDDALRDVSLRYLQEGQTFAFYLGHSNAPGFWSNDAPFLRREDWSSMKIPRGAGVFFTCGCFGCQLQGDDGEGYGLAAMRNPQGPAAVMGAHGESYAAAGQLAMDGMLQLLSRPDPPERLADYWLAVKQGLAKGPMDRLTFWLYDQADGSRGKTSMDLQRQEHLEMWMLLGDPAMKLPVVRPTIKLQTAGEVVARKVIKVTGVLPKEFADATVHVSLERPTGSTAVGLRPVPKDAIRAREVAMENHDRANTLALAAEDVQARDGRFECMLKLPDELPWRQLTIRAVATSKNDTAMGVSGVTPGN